MARPPSLTLRSQSSPCSCKYHHTNVQLSPSTATGGKVAHTCPLCTSTTLREAFPLCLLYCSSKPHARGFSPCSWLTQSWALRPPSSTIAVLRPRLTRVPHTFTRHASI